jgi:hypothetical protein
MGEWKERKTGGRKRRGRNIFNCSHYIYNIFVNAQLHKTIKTEAAVTKIMTFLKLHGLHLTDLPAFLLAVL